MKATVFLCLARKELQRQKTCMHKSKIKNLVARQSSKTSLTALEIKYKLGVLL
jgi:hypothetical protein